MERGHIKRSKKLDLIASTQMEAAQLEAKLNEDNVVLITLKQRHLAELKVNDDVCQLAGGRVQSQAVCYKLAIVTRALPLGTTASARHTRTD